MRKNQRFLTRLLSGAAISAIIVFAVADQSLSIPKTAESSLVATVNGVEILYAELSIDREKLQRRFASKHARPASSEEDEAELRTEKFVLERDRLTKRIRTSIRQQQAERFALNVNEDDLRRMTDEIKRHSDPPEIVAANRAKLQLLLEALRRVFERGEEATEVYRSLPDDSISTIEWQAALNTYATPRTRELLEQTLTGEPKELLPNDRGVREFLLDKKLEDAVETELVRFDPEFAEYVRLSKSDPTNAKVREKPPMYRDAKRDEWWQRKYREAKVEILDERFKEAWPPK